MCFNECLHCMCSGKKAEMHDRLNPDWAPSLNLRTSRSIQTPPPVMASTSTTPALSRYNRHMERAQRKLDMSQFASLGNMS